MVQKRTKTTSNRSLTTTLAIAFAVLCTSVLIISVCFEMYVHLQSQKEMVAARQQNMAQKAAGQVTAFINEKFKVIDAAIHASDLSSIGRGKQKDALHVILGMEPVMRQVLLFDARNVKLAMASRLSRAASESTMAHVTGDVFTGVRQTGRYLGPIFVDPVTSEPMLIGALPLKDFMGNVKGTLVMELNLKFMWDLIEDIEIGRHGSAYVVNKKGYLIAFKDTARVLRGENVSRLKPVATFMNTPSTDNGIGVSISAGINGDLVLGSYVPLKKPEWAVVTELPLLEAYRKILQIASVSLLFITVIAVSAAMIGVRLARRLSAPILDLKNTATRIAEGQKGLKAAIQGSAEVVVLAGAFNRMTEQLQAMLDAEAERAGKLAHEVQNRLKAEEALQESRSILTATLESTHDGVLVVSEGGKVTHHNSRFAEIWSIPENLLKTKNDEDLIAYVLSMLVEPEQFTAKVQELYESSERSEDLLNLKDGRILERHSYPLMQGRRKTGRAWFFRDITKRRLAAEALNKERDRIANILEATSAGTCEWNYQTGEVHLNPRWAEIMGKTLEELEPIGVQTLTNSAHPDDLPRIRHILGQLISREVDYFDLEFRQPHKDGSWVWVNSRGKIVEWTEDGKPLCISGTNLDITQRKQDEEAQRLTRVVFEKAPIGIWHLGLAGEVFDVNEAGCASLGYTREELRRMTIFDLDPDFSPEQYAATAAILRAAGFHVLESRQRRKNGELFPVQVISNLVRFENQEICVAFIQDITERKKYMEDLRQLRNYLANIIDSMPSVLVGVDLEGRVTQWNRRAEQVTGLLSNQALTKPLESVFARLADQMAPIKTAIQERRTISASKVTRRAEQETRYEDITIFPLVANGVEGAVIRVDDVTEQVRMEEMMVQTEKMLSIGGLAAGMAHEINNPMAGMLQTAMVLENRLTTRLHIPANQKAAEAAGTTMEAIEQFMQDRRIHEMLATIKNTGHRVVALVENMLSFARKSEAKLSTTDLGMLMDKTVELAGTDYDLKKGYDFRKITIVKEYAGAPVSAACESAKIQQVLLNLFRNGAQAMQEAAIESPMFILRTRLDHNPDMAVMEIEDNGPGMDETTRKKIFEPFFTTKPTGVGTGLGLSVSYFIITEDHQGEMSVESSPGYGAKFTIRLPMQNC
ncbi:two component system sensor histidine kinase [Desulfosarcina variabilis str. Montpellier]|uniref:PAS domain S-box protein n=1 Tax=Desulfosarcina variabilis TaxID=2300 RepID=UPI003AFB7E44